MASPCESTARTRAVLLLLLLSLTAAQTSNWTCVTHVTKSMVPSDPSAIKWWQGNCSGETPFGKVGPMLVNLITADLTNPKLLLRPLAAKTANSLDTLPNIMHQDARLLAAVNGGYFYRLDRDNFFDDVCFFKSKDEALHPVNASQPNWGVGDSLMVQDGKLVASNCKAIYGYNRPSTLLINGTFSNIIVQHTADPAPEGTMNAIAAGPNLVSWTPEKGAYIDIPKEDQNVNIIEKAANTAIGLSQAGKSTLLHMVTFNGDDGCWILDPRCGISAYPLAYFMKDYLKDQKAMGMDQGGSTTMVVKGEANNGVVTCAGQPCEAPRNIFNGLFVGYQAARS